MRTPLKPIIEIVRRTPSKLCNCCGSDDLVWALHLGWREHIEDNPRPHAGSTSIALCRSCRVAVANVAMEGQ